MRLVALAILAVLSVPSLAGCADAPTSEPSPEVPVDDPMPIVQGVAAPVYRTGQSWTYRTAGYWDSTETVTVVVARADAPGYLLAGATTADLADEVTWDRAYFGPVDLQLKPMGGSADAWLRFPLSDGANWTVGRIPVTAREGQVASPSGRLVGYAIRGAANGTSLEVDYAPSLGVVTHFARRHEDEPGPSETLDLVSTGSSASWTWFERGAEVYYTPTFDDPLQLPSAAPATIDVTDEDDAVYAWALASAGSQVVVASPAGAPWIYEGEGESAFALQVFPATPGPWAVGVVPGDAAGSAYVSLQAVRYLTGP